MDMKGEWIKDTGHKNIPVFAEATEWMVEPFMENGNVQGGSGLGREVWINNYAWPH